MTTEKKVARRKLTLLELVGQFDSDCSANGSVGRNRSQQTMQPG